MALRTENFYFNSFSGFTCEKVFRGGQPASLFTPSGTSRPGFPVLLPPTGARTRAGGRECMALRPENCSFNTFSGFAREKVFRGREPASENLPGTGPSGPPCPSVFSWSPVRTRAPPGWLPFLEGPPGPMSLTSLLLLFSALCILAMKLCIRNSRFTTLILLFGLFIPLTQHS